MPLSAETGEVCGSGWGSDGCCLVSRQVVGLYIGLDSRKFIIQDLRLAGDDIERHRQITLICLCLNMQDDTEHRYMTLLGRCRGTRDNIVTTALPSYSVAKDWRMAAWKDCQPIEEMSLHTC